jgi:hypothetical protein
MAGTYRGLTGRVTSIVPRQPTWWERIIRFFTGGTVSNPTGLTASFDQPSYPPGAPMTLTVRAIAGTTPEDVTATVTFFKTSDPATPVGTATADTTVEEIDELSSTVTDSQGRKYTPGPASQDGASYTAQFTAPA